MVDREDFEIMVDEFIADHEEEYADDPLVIDGIELSDDGLGWVCHAHVSKTGYFLWEPEGDGNIRIEYDGTR